MSPLQERLAELRAKVRQLLWVYGVCWSLAVLFGTLLLVGSADWLMHLDDAGVRLILGLGILSSVSYVAYRFLISPLRVPLTDLDLALRIERRFPQFRDALASTIQFLQANKDPSLGAPDLQQRVIDKTLKQAKFLDFEDVVQSKPVQRVAWTALVICVTTVLVVGFNQAEAATALKRLVFPFGAHPWPKRVHLQFVNSGLEQLIPNTEEPIRIARGDTLELTAINLNDRGRMPTIVHLEFKHPDGSVTREAMQRSTIKDNSRSRESAFASLVVKSPFEFRAVGGDDQEMEWFTLEVVPPPVAESLQVTLTPPKYSRRPVVELSPGVGHIEALVGTVVKIQATANKPLGPSLLRVKDKDQFPLKLSEDGLRLNGSFTIKEAGVYSYWLDLRDTQNFGNSDAARYEIRATQDATPDIYIDQPATDIQVTPTVELPIRLIAKDDLGLRLIRMPYTTQATEAADFSPQVEIPLAQLDQRPLHHTVDFLWKLEPLKLTPGMKVQFHAEATDDYDLGAPHIGHSIVRTLTVISPEDKSQELNNRQAGLLNQLSRLKKQESEIEAQTGELKKQLEKAGALRPQDQDLLQRIEGQQRQFSAAIQNPQEGILAKTQEILNELHQNHVDAPDTRRRLDQIQAELKRLNSEHLPAIEQQLTQARKEATGSGSSSARPKSPTEIPSPTKGPGTSESPANKPPTPGSPQTSTPMPPSKEGPQEPKAANPGDTPATPTEVPQGSPPASPPPVSPPPVSPPPGSPLSETAKRPGTTPEVQPAATPPEKPAGAPINGTDNATGAVDKPARPERVPEKPRPGASAMEQALHRAQHHEQIVSETLEGLLQELSQWQDEREAMASLQEIRKDQEKINQETAQLGAKTVTKSMQELKPQEQADLARQAERQGHEAQQIDQLQRKLGAIVERLAQENPEAAGRLQDVLEQLKQNQIAGKMRDAARQVGENNIGQAGQTQQQVAKDLEALEKTLKSEAASDLESLVKQIDQAEEALAKLQHDQEELIKQTQAAEQQSDPMLKEQQLEQLKKQQEERQREAELLAHKLERLKLDRPAKAAQRAAERMQQAREELQKEGNHQAEELEQEALQDLEQARRELAQERKQAEDVLAREQLEKVADEIKALTERQRSIVEEMKRLNEAFLLKGNWTRPQLKSLRDLAEVQRGLQVETTGLVEKLSAAKVFALAAKGAARNMEQAAARLDEKDTGNETQHFAQSALQRFLDLVDAMKPEPPKPPTADSEAEQQPGKNGGGNQGAPPVDAVAVIAELKMLRSMQSDLNSRMVILAEKRDQGNPLTAAELEELKKLGAEQGELAEIAAKFVEMFNPQGAAPQQVPAP